MLSRIPHFLVPLVKAQSCCLRCCATDRLYTFNTCCTRSRWDAFSFCVLAECPDVNGCVLLCGQRRKGHLSSLRKALCAFRKFFFVCVESVTTVKFGLHYVDFCVYCFVSRMGIGSLHDRCASFSRAYNLQVPTLWKSCHVSIHKTSV
uniref:Secreted protein n=1 Tax=Rhipicephalus appendiculatus TaxID=34631 RepID=A0A131YE18_RHIAP